MDHLIHLLIATIAITLGQVFSSIIKNYFNIGNDKSNSVDGSDSGE